MNFVENKGKKAIHAHARSLVSEHKRARTIQTSRISSGKIIQIDRIVFDQTETTRSVLVFHFQYIFRVKWTLRSKFAWRQIFFVFGIFHYCNLIKLQKSKNMYSISIFPPKWVIEWVTERKRGKTKNEVVCIWFNSFLGQIFGRAQIHTHLHTKWATQWCKLWTQNINFLGKNWHPRFEFRILNSLRKLHLQDARVSDCVCCACAKRIGSNKFWTGIWAKKFHTAKLEIQKMKPVINLHATIVV